MNTAPKTVKAAPAAAQKTEPEGRLTFPASLWMVILVALPFLYIFILSFLTRGATGRVEFSFTMENYARIFSPVYVKIFGVTLVLAFVTVLLTLAAGYPFAYFLARLGPKYRFLGLMLLMVPFWTSSLLRTYGWIILLRNDGIVNTLLQWLRLTSEPLRLLYTYGAVLTGTVYMLLPFMVLPVYNAVEKLDNSLLEASRDLGAGRFQTFRRVTLPLTVPGIAGGVTLVFISAVGLFFISDLLGGAKTMLLGNLIYNQMLTSRDWPFGAALSMVMMAGVLLLLGASNTVSARAGKGARP